MWKAKTKRLLRVTCNMYVTIGLTFDYDDAAKKRLSSIFIRSINGSEQFDSLQVDVSEFIGKKMSLKEWR